MNDSRQAPQFRSVLVTGGTGFLGEHLVHRLHATGVSVAAVVRPTSKTDRIADHADIRTHSGESDGLIALVRDAKPDVILHLAARFASAHAPGDIAGMIADNVTFTAQLCEAAVAAECTALVAAGTAWQNAGSAPGDPTPAPNTLYAASKQAADDTIDYFSRMAGLNAITLKIYDSYGAGDPRRKFLTVLRDATQSGESIDATHGDQRLHMVHVDDLVDGFVHAANLLVSGSVKGRASHTLPSREAMPLKAIADAWMHASGQDVSINWGAKPHRDGEVMVPWEGSPLPGWTPRIDLETGLADS